MPSMRSVDAFKPLHFFDAFLPLHSVARKTSEAEVGDVVAAPVSNGNYVIDGQRLYVEESDINKAREWTTRKKVF